MMLFPTRSRRGAAITLAAVAAVAALAVTGCVAPEAGDTSDEPVSGGTLVVAQASDFQPQVVLGLRGGNVGWVANVFEPLARVDAETGEPEPVLAAAWTFAADGLSVDIDLRDDVTFHSGRQMTADDVKWTIDFSTTPEAASQFAFIAKQFSSVEVTSPTTLTISFAQQMSHSVFFDYIEQTYILDQETVAGLADGSQVVGTGPFVWGEYSPGVSLTLDRYEDYRDVDTTYLDSIEFNRAADSTALLSALRSTAAQVGLALTLVDAQGLASDPAFQVIDSGGTIYPFGVDVNVAPFDDVRVRQALQYAIDRDRINEQVFAGAGTPTDLFWSPTAPGVTEELATHYTYDPDKARELIEEAGATGADVPITVLAQPLLQSEYEIIANNLTEVGLSPRAVPVDEATFNSMQNQGQMGPAFLLLHGQVGFGETTMLNSLPSLRANNPSHFDSPEYQELRNALIAAIDQDEIATATADLSEYMLEQAWTVPILQARGKIVLTTTVHDVATTKRGYLLFNTAFITE